MTSKIAGYFKGIRAGTLLIAAVAAVVSKTVIKTELVPEQLRWLSEAGVLAAMSALAATPSVSTRPRKLLTRILLVAMVMTFCAVIAVRASLTQEIEINRQSRRYLVGYRLTELGKTMEHNCMIATAAQNLPHLPRYELIKCAGETSIPEIYGSSYTEVAAIYLISYLSFLGIFVLLVNGIFDSESKDLRPSG
jgi:hypothetical protein